MIQYHPQKCLLCSSEKSETIIVFHSPDQYETSIGVEPDGYFRRWVCCSDCGFYYSQYSRADGMIEKIYQNAYRNKGAAWRSVDAFQTFNNIIQLPEEESETKARVKWIKNRLETLCNCGLSGNPGGLLLDIGGGNGIFAYEFMDDIWRSYVMDPDENGLFIKERLGMPFVHGSYKSGSFDVKFDIISLIFVLEHLSRPDIILKDIRNDMQKDCFIYIEVPDAICFDKKDHRDDIFNSCHLWMFSPHSLTRLLYICGFEVFILERMRTKRGHFALMILAGLR